MNLIDELIQEHTRENPTVEIPVSASTTLKFRLPATYAEWRALKQGMATFADKLRTKKQCAPEWLALNPNDDGSAAVAWYLHSTAVEPTINVVESLKLLKCPELVEMIYRALESARTEKLVSGFAMELEDAKKDSEATPPEG
ncbi:MAG: hypothetical protein EON58_01985 [Alphaproteobacteria bacterium]|nr:MAG: hypothetical protein EON58_01985 [Alphaproteobacteria bacterium]